MSADLPTIDDKFWERLRFKGLRLKEYVLCDIPAIPGNRLTRRLRWQSFKEDCAAKGNVLPRLIYFSEPQDFGFGMFPRRGPRTPRGSYAFDDLPFPQCMEADRIFRRMCVKWEGNLPSWRRAILIGRARRLALHPLDSEWGKRMRRVKGGVHCQRKYRELGRHPLENVRHAMTKRHQQAIPPQKGRLKAENPVHRRSRNTSAHFQQESLLNDVLHGAKVGVEELIEAFRFSGDDDTIKFVRKYDSLPVKDRKSYSIEQIYVAAGIPTERALPLTLASYMEFSMLTCKLRASANLVRVVDAAIKRAKTKGGHADRRLILEMAGIAPTRL